MEAFRPTGTLGALVSPGAAARGDRLDGARVGSGAAVARGRAVAAALQRAGSRVGHAEVDRRAAALQAQVGRAVLRVLEARVDRLRADLGRDARRIGVERALEVHARRAAGVPEDVVAAAVGGVAARLEHLERGAAALVSGEDVVLEVRADRVAGRGAAEGHVGRGRAGGVVGHDGVVRESNVTLWPSTLDGLSPAWPFGPSIQTPQSTKPQMRFPRIRRVCEAARV